MGFSFTDTILADLLFMQAEASFLPENAGFLAGVWAGVKKEEGITPWSKWR
jgi:hypothetical protein